MLRGQAKDVSRAGGALQVLTNPLKAENPEIQSSILWANHPHIQKSQGLKEYKEQPKDGFLMGQKTVLSGQLLCKPSTLAGRKRRRFI
jgi:hypothetical protein